METERRPHGSDSLGVSGIGLGVFSLACAFIVAALSFGGVLTMGTAAICLGLAGLTGGAGVILAALWLKPWLREGARVALAISGLLAVGVGLVRLYGWIDINGHRPEQTRESARTVNPPSKPTRDLGTSASSPPRPSRKSHDSKTANKNNSQTTPSPTLEPPHTLGLPQQNDKTPQHVTVQPGGVVSFGQQGGQTAGTIINHGPAPVTITSVSVFDNAPIPQGAITLYESRRRVTLSGPVLVFSARVVGSDRLVSIFLVSEDNEWSTGTAPMAISGGVGIATLQNAYGHLLLRVLSRSPEQHLKVDFGCEGVQCTLLSP